MEATVSEIHAYPLRPEGYAEPLFHSQRSRRQILAHLAESPWLGRASELAAPARPDGTGGDRYPAGRVLCSWREVDRWWEADGGVDRILYLAELCTGKQEVRSRSVRKTW